MTCTKIDYEKLTRIAKSITWQYHDEQLTEDFTQIVLLANFNGRKASVGQLLIDFLRQEFGDNRYNRNRNLKFANLISMEEYMDTGVMDYKEDEFLEIIDLFEGDNRTVLMLLYKWGFSMKEVGEVLGVTESRVCQIHKELSKRLVNKMARC